MWVPVLSAIYCEAEVEKEVNHEVKKETVTQSIEFKNDIAGKGQQKDSIWESDFNGGLDRC